MTKLIAMFIVAAIAVGVLFGMWKLASFDQEQFYVRVTDEKSKIFPDELAKITSRNGLAAAVGKATDDHNNTLYAIDGSSLSLRLWAQNLPLSGNESPVKCGLAVEPRPDPRQFVVTIEARFPFFGRARRQMSARIKQGIENSGYEARSVPVECG